MDHPKPLGVFLVKPEQELVEMDVYRPAKSEGLLSEGLLSLDFCLRDRDHARATMGQAGQRSALCVGDKAGDAFKIHSQGCLGPRHRVLCM